MKKTILLFLAASVCGFAAEPAANWTPLPASAWHWFGHKKEEGLPQVWTVEADGTLHRAAGDGSWAKQDLASDEGTYENFVFEFEWKVGKGANSGVFYRGKESGQPWGSAFEYQVLDDDNFNKGAAKPFHRAGALYSIIEPNAEKVLKPVGEWNVSRIVADGTKIEHWLNGKCIVKVDLESPEFKDIFAKSEWKGSPGKGKSGTITLQDHGGEVWYRNIRVQKLAK